MTDNSTVDSRTNRDVDLASYACLAVMVLITSSTAPAAKFAVRELPTGLLLLVRFGVAGLCLTPLAGRSALSRLWRDDARALALTAALCVPINQTFFLNAARLTPTSHVALFYAACPLVVLLLATTLGQERLAPSRLAGVLSSIGGVLVIGLGNLLHGGTESRSALLGDILLVGAVTSWGAYLTVSKPLISRHGALPVLAGTFVVGSVISVPLVLAGVRSWPPLAGASVSAWRGMIYLTFVVTIVGLAFQNLALRRLDASQVATFGNVAPVLTVAWGVWLFREPLTSSLLVGAALVLGGIVWASRPSARSQITPMEARS